MSNVHQVIVIDDGESPVKETFKSPISVIKRFSMSSIFHINHDAEKCRYIQVPALAVVRQESPFINNSVRSARFTTLNFLPKQLLFQFSKLANFYFLVVSILQLIPNLSSTGQFTTIIPLSLFVALAIAREGYDDRRRAKQDKSENQSRTCILAKSKSSGGEEWKYVQWQQLYPGDRVLIRNNEQFPADILLLNSSEDEGVCYVETMNLDGETNLKPKKALPITVDKIKTVQDLAASTYSLKVQLPNNNLYSFEGSLSLEKGELIPLSLDQLLVRGSTLKKTGWVMGIVVYTGEDTKIRRNSNKKLKSKNSVMDSTMTNRIVVLMFCFILIISLVSFILYLVTWNRNLTYLGADTHRDLAKYQYFTFLILYNSIIPVSLYVTLEMVKLAQALLIENDVLMYDEGSDTPACSRTSSLNEDLGQVSFLFTDKTGTLTENNMILRYISVAGQLVSLYNTGENDGSDADTLDNFMNHIKKASPSSMHLEFMRAITLCHSVIASYPDTGDQPSLRDIDLLSDRSSVHSMEDFSDEKFTESIVYQATSPDDVAIMIGCRVCKFPFLKRVRNEVTYKDANGKVSTVKVGQILEFTSSRKCMSVIYEKDDGSYVLYCKGADSVIVPKSIKSANDHSTFEHVKKMSKTGLRTLLVAKRDLSAKEFQTFIAKYKEASVSLENRDEKMENIAKEVETNLTIIGATGIEDQLQEGVPITIDKLRRAGIKIWVLTGDKRETVINIGQASKIIKPDDTIIQLGKDLESSLDQEWRSLHENLGQNRVLVVDGQELQQIESNPDLVDKFILFSSLVSTVICCRVSPSQKALMVRHVRKRLQVLVDAARDMNPDKPFGTDWPMTLDRYHASLSWYKRFPLYKVYKAMNRKILVTCAIGDGANDVAMIQEAHVGLGIAGREGLQASRAADYSIGQFRFLQSMILIHGHWNYCRNANFLLGSFYKTVVFYLTQFVFQFYCLFSGTSLYEQWTLALFNVIWASLTVLATGTFDQRHSKREMLLYPEFYHIGPDFQLYNLKRFMLYLILAIFQSAWTVIFLGFSCSGSRYDDEYGMFGFGIIVYSCIILILNLKLSLFNAFHFAWPILVCPFFTIVLWFGGFQPLYSIFYGPTELGAEIFGVFFGLFSNPMTYFNIVFVVTVALLPETIISWYFYKPVKVQKLREIDALPISLQ